MNGLMIISGGFGVFRAANFCRPSAASRATRSARTWKLVHPDARAARAPLRPGARIEFAADATSWTEAPSGAPSRCAGSAIRWHIGLLDNLRIHRRMLGRRRYGAVGLLSLPYTVLVEVMGPRSCRSPATRSVIVLVVFDEIAWEYAIALLVVVLLVAQLQTRGRS
jgi:hypothetical protein